MGKTLDYLVNDEIKYPNDKLVRIVGNDIESKVISLADARHISEELNLDMILINAKLDTPIIRLDRYDKFLFDMKKAIKKNKAQNITMKEIDLRVNIAPNDLETKVRQAKSFIGQGHKVKVVLTMKGRELGRREYSKDAINKFIEGMGDVADIDGKVKDEGNKTIVIFKKK